jgi:type VI secretion system protein ImpJ
MSTHNRVIWSEGLFLQPQHFQQQERYFERYVETRCRALIPHSWGFAEAEIRRELLAIGKFGLLRATAVFPDGTPVRLPDDDPEPAPIDIACDVRNEIVYLAVPVRHAAAREVDQSAGPDMIGRQLVRELEAPDVASMSGESAVLQVGALRTRLLLRPDLSGAYTSIPLARIIECRPDRQVVLDESFIPTVLQARAAAPLATFLIELAGLMRQRGEALASRMSAAGRGAAAELAGFLMLQVINRYEPLVAHLAESAAVHPEDLYRVLVAAAGELATFTLQGKRAPSFPRYAHDALRESFEPIIAALRKSLGTHIADLAVSIPIEPRQAGISVALVPDRTLYSTAVFVLAVRAAISAEELRQRIPKQLKLGPVETISSLVNYSLPGVPVHPMPVAPRQIPYHAGSVYFEVDQSDPLWNKVKSSGGIGLQIGGEFPDLGLELWAVRSG